MERPEIVKMLNDLAEARATMAVTRLDYEEKRKAILATVQAELDALEAEYGPALAAGTEYTANLTEQIKTAVLAAGETIKGTHIMAVFARGRETWDSKGLAGYAVAHPEVYTFQKIGEPSISLRDVK